MADSLNQLNTGFFGIGDRVVITQGGSLYYGKRGVVVNASDHDLLLVDLDTGPQRYFVETGLKFEWEDE